MRYCSLLVHFLLAITAFSAYGQFGHEWINYNQSYYKIAVVKNGIHRLTYDDLSTAGVPVNSVDPRRIQIFRRGVEQAINFHYLETPADALFEQGEYLEFYGEKNDGATDVDLYKNPAHHPHSYYNLYSDTATYFLTWNLLPVQGKRMTLLNPENNVNSLPAEVGFTSTALQVFSDQYSPGLTYAGLVQSSFFDEGEGWTGPLICNSGCPSQQDFSFSIPGGVTSLSPPQLELLLVGRIEAGHAAEIYAGTSTGSLRLVTTSAFQNFQTAKVTVPLLWTDVAGDGTVVIRVRGLGVGGAIERMSVSYVKIDYIRNFNWSGLNAQLGQLLPNGGNKSYIEIQNPTAGLRLFDITDLTASSIIGTYTVGSNLGCIITNTSSSRKLFVSTEFFTPTIVKKVSFRSITPAAHNYIIISNSVLRKSALGYGDPVKAYAEYRASAIGGSYDTLLVNIDQLYNQFNYGETSARAIYQFMKFMANSGNPKYLFLIGKGLEINFAYDRHRVVLSTDLNDLVPTAGYPGADLIFTAGLKGTTYQPAIPVGRLVTSSSFEVASYLNKIKETEQLPFDALWRKNILHLSGGINPGEPQAFKYFVDGFKSIATDVYLGASVNTKSKRTLSLESIPIADQINNGLALVTFFGHSSSSALDFEIGFATQPELNYNNAGRYPAFIINGCNAGRIFDNRTGTNVSLGEDWIAAPNKGAKAFIAHCSFGFESSLRQYTDMFYRIAMGDSILLTMGIGDVQKKVAETILNFSGPGINNLSIVYQMVLNGDPAVKLFGAPKPDYAIKNDFLSKVSFDGKPITVATESFGIKFKIRNYGQARTDSVPVTLTRIFPDNSIITSDTLVPPVFYENEFVFIVKNANKKGGQNTFILELDKNNERVELSELNNKAHIDIFIPNSSTYNLVPAAYSIVNTASVELIFQNTNQLPMVRDFQLEVDTLPTFNSPFLIQRKVTANVLARTTINLAAKDSTVYYWRTRLFQPTQDESTEWFTTSFSNIKGGGPGWAQLRYPQFSDNTFINVQQNSSGSFIFPEYVSTVNIKNFGSQNTTPYEQTSFKVNNEELNLGIQSPPCRLNTINMVAFDKSTGNAYPAIPFTIVDQRTCGREPQVINSFTLAEAEAATNGLIQAISNVAFNDSLIFFSIGDAGVQSFSTALLTKLEEAGVSASQLTGFQAGEPLIIFGRKGATAGSALVIRSTVAPLDEQELIVNKTLTARANSGHVSSVLIGPAKEWFSLSRRVDKVEPTDNFTIQVLGVSAGKPDQILYSGNQNNINLTFIDRSMYPVIKLKLITTDETNLTPVDLKNWVVHYKPVPEGILLFRGDEGPVVKQEGEIWSTKFSYINLTAYNFVFNDFDEPDVLPVELKILNHEKAKTEIETIQIKAPEPRDSTVFIWERNSIGLNGLNDIHVQVSPISNHEQYNFNNQMLKENYLQVIPDLQPPVLDVTVDDRYLMNGDVVSPTPVVNVKIIDENIFWFKTDTIGIQIFIKDLGTSVNKRINFTNPNLTWSPASVEDDFLITFQLNLTAGEYELSVQGADASGNSSGPIPYTVSFVVTDDLHIQFGEPFPNPSTASFSFPVRLSGDELPESLSLKIISPDGRLIKQFNLSDVSGFYVGTNYLKWNAHESSSVHGYSGLYYFKLEIKVAGKVFSKVGRLLLAR
jgi:hypothetical protein